MNNTNREELIKVIRDWYETEDGNRFNYMDFEGDSLKVDGRIPYKLLLDFIEQRETAAYERGLKEGQDKGVKDLAEKIKDSVKQRLSYYEGIYNRDSLEQVYLSSGTLNDIDAIVADLIGKEEDAN